MLYLETKLRFMSPKLRSALFRQASLSATFISENGIVAVLGDENQFVKGSIRKINRPLTFERGHQDQIRVPKGSFREDLDVRVVPNIKKQVMEIRH